MYERDSKSRRASPPGNTWNHKSVECAPRIHARHTPFRYQIVSWDPPNGKPPQSRIKYIFLALPRLASGGACCISIGYFSGENIVRLCSGNKSEAIVTLTNSHSLPLSPHPHTYTHAKWILFNIRLNNILAIVCNTGLYSALPSRFVRFTRWPICHKMDLFV